MIKEAKDILSKKYKDKEMYKTANAAKYLPYALAIPALTGLGYMGYEALAPKPTIMGRIKDFGLGAMDVASRAGSDLMQSGADIMGDVSNVATSNPQLLGAVAQKVMSSQPTTSLGASSPMNPGHYENYLPQMPLDSDMDYSSLSAMQDRVNDFTPYNY
jgi:hypothetical protein